MTQDRLDRARQHIETHVASGLHLDDVAAAAGLSPFHFARAFAARYGLTPMAYVRTRRLAQAADRLAQPDPPPLTDLAFDAGFDSQQAFTRAFKRTFGAPPGAFGAHRASLQETQAMTDLAPGRLTQSADPVRKPALRIAGLTRDFSHEDVSGIPGLWKEFAARLPLPGQLGGTYGVCEAAPAGGLRYTAGVELADGVSAPAGLEIVELAARSYIVFGLEIDGGDLHPQMQAAVKEIWGVRMPASRWTMAKAPDLEVYPPGFRPGVAGVWLEWWVPVEV